MAKQKMAHLSVLASGNGSNLQAIIEASKKGEIPNAQVALVVVNRPEAFARERARREKIPELFLNPQDYPDRETYFARIITELENYQVDLICLAGFLLQLTPNIISRYRGKILNIHPALLPKFGGKGLYGQRVHEAVLAAGEKESGATVHFVDEEYDHGPAIIQKRVPVLAGDTAQSLADRILTEEHKIYPQAIRLVLEKLMGKAL